MALSPNYGWAEPDNSSLVKNGAQDIRALGDAIDTSVWNVGYGQAGKNKVINGDFGVWQRGNTFNSAVANAFSADRWSFDYNGGGTRNITQETFTTGTAPVAGYEGQYYLKIDQTVAAAGATTATFYTRIENARTFAGQTVTVSFWAKTDSNRTTASAPGLSQSFGTGGSPSSAVVTNAASTLSFTTSWTRYSFNINVPSVSGKTFGTNNNSFLQLNLRLFLNTTFTFEIWGVQVEYGSKATPFQTASGGSPQAELAMCQRYYYRGGNGAYSSYGTGFGTAATTATALCPLPVEMRIVPSSVDYSNLCIVDSGSRIAISSLSLNIYSSKTSGGVDITVASGVTTTRPYFIQNNNNTAAYIGFSAEL
jgi:hypothetical protein